MKLRVFWYIYISKETNVSYFKYLTSCIADRENVYVLNIAQTVNRYMSRGYASNKHAASCVVLEINTNLNIYRQMDRLRHSSMRLCKIYINFQLNIQICSFRTCNWRYLDL